MKSFFNYISMVFVLILALNINALAQCDINLDCPEDVLLYVDPPIFDINTSTINFNNIEIGSFACNDANYASGMAFYIYQLLPDGSRIEQCTVIGEAPFNVVGNVSLLFGQSTFCGFTTPLGTISLLPSEGFEACDGALLEAEAVLYITEQTDIDVVNASVYSQLPSNQYVVLDLGTIEININNEFPGNGQPLTTAEIRDFNTQAEGPQNLTCGQDIELYVEGLSLLANCRPYEEISTGITSELTNEFYYQINGGEPIIIIDESTGGQGGQLTGPDPNLNGICYAGILNFDTPYVLSYSELPQNLCEGSEITFTLRTTDMFTNETAEDTYTVIYAGSCTVCEIEGCTNPCASNFDASATIDDGSCMLPEQPELACYQTATFNEVTCAWDLSGEQPTQPTDLACYQSVGTFDDVDCVWPILGEQPIIDDGCDLTTDSLDEVTCMAVNTSTCEAGTTLDEVNCVCVIDVILGCTDSCASNYNPNANQNDDSCILPEAPTNLACYEMTNFNTASCLWEVTGVQPDEPAIACYETASFNDNICDWEVEGVQPAQPTDLACYQSLGIFDEVDCVWPILGEQPTIDDDCDITTDSFDEVTCMAVNTPNCEAGTSFDANTCNCTEDPVSGCIDDTACNYDPNATVDDGSCTFLPAEPVDLACYEMATANLSTCDWDVTGQQPMEPPTACYETATFDNTICNWVITGDEVIVDDGCDITADTLDEITCMPVNTPNCQVNTSFDAANCLCNANEVDGCTDSCDPNYDPASTNDDLCAGYDTVCDDEDDCTEDFYDMTICSCMNLLPPTQSCECSPIPNCEGCTNPCAINFDPYAQLDDNSCEFADIDDGCDLTTDTIDPNTCEAIYTPNCPDGALFDSVNCLCETELGPCCTDPCAFNYDPNCTTDDSSCELPPNFDDGCDLTTDTFGSNCDIIHTANCPDDTVFNSEDCLCENVVECTPPQPGVIDCE